MIPASKRSQYAPVAASKPSPGFELADGGRHDRRVVAGVAGDLAQRLPERAADDLRAGRLVRVRGRRSRSPPRRSAARRRRRGGSPRAARRASPAPRPAPGACARRARSRSSAPTRITAICPPRRAMRSRSLSRSYSLRWPFSSSSLRSCRIRCSTVSRVAAAADDRRHVAVDDDALGPPELRELDVVEREAELLRDVRPAGQDRQVLVHEPSLRAVLRRRNGDRRDEPAHLVDDERRERVAREVLAEQQQRLAGRDQLVEQRQQLVGACSAARPRWRRRRPRARPPCARGR